MNSMPPDVQAQSSFSIPNGQNPIQNLNAFCDKFEVNIQFIPILQKLNNFRAILICDDSGSMNEAADPDVGLSISRWEELKKTVQIIVLGYASVNSYVDIYFINRPGIRNVTSWNQCAGYFAAPPAGKNVIHQIFYYFHYFHL